MENMREELQQELSKLSPRGRGRAYPKGLMGKVLSYTVARRRQGAKLVERPEDVLCELKISLVAQLVASVPGAPPQAQLRTPPLDKEYKILLDALAFEPASVDSLIERTGMNSESIASMLLILELDGHVAPHPGGRYSRMAGK